MPAGAPGHHWLGGFCRQAATLWILVLVAIPAIGQTAPTSDQKTRLGSVHGTLTTTQADASGGLAGITVQLATQPPAGSPLTADTDDAGRYEFKDVQPGAYTISVSQTGFAPYTKSLQLKPGEAAVVDIRLELQTVAEQVEVSETTQSLAKPQARSRNSLARSGENQRLPSPAAAPTVSNWHRSPC